MGNKGRAILSRRNSSAGSRRQQRPWEWLVAGAGAGQVPAKPDRGVGLSPEGREPWRVAEQEGTLRQGSFLTAHRFSGWTFSSSGCSVFALWGHTKEPADACTNTFTTVAAGTVPQPPHPPILHFPLLSLPPPSDHMSNCEMIIGLALPVLHRTPGRALPVFLPWGRIPRPECGFVS